MPVREGPAQPAPPPKEPEPYPAEKARGGEIILGARSRRIIFIAGLVGIVVLALLFLA
ncbi:MAG: peptide ABC transporter permease [Variibacter sp.]|nr:peptide ABC transporter permease [Variibacter sp.]